MLTSEPRQNAAEILTIRAREIVLPEKLAPLTGKALHGGQALYSAVLDMLANTC